MGGSRVLIAEDLGRRFGRRRALHGVDVELRRGQILGLVGPNGSGKTTLLKILAGFLAPSSGHARVFGLDPFRERARIMERTRFAFAPPALFENLTAREHLRFLARIGSSRVEAREIERALETVGLLERARDRVRTFSFGMRQRLALAQALLPRPELLVLDEPTDGLDPLAILELRAVLKGLRQELGITILLSSHLLIEIDELVDRMLVLSEGRAIFQGAPDELRAGGDRLILRAGRTEPVLARLAELGHEAWLDGRGAIELTAGAIDLGRAAELCRAAGTELEAFHLERPSLEEALLERLRRERPEGRP